MNSEYFTWPDRHLLAEIGPFNLPFDVSVIGLVVAVIGYLVITSYMAKPKEESRKSRRRRKTEEAQEPVTLPVWQHLAVFFGALVGAQIIFSVIGGGGSSELGPIVLRWYGLLFAGAFLTGYFWTRKLWQDAGRDVMEVDSLLMYVIVATVVGARLGEVLFYEFEYYARNPIEIFYIWQGGLASHGATIGILTGLYLFMRNHKGMTFFWLTDRVTMPVILGGAFIRLGNFFNSEIYGSPTDVSWAIVFERLGDQIPRHPTMLYEMITSLLIFGLIVAIYKKYKANPPTGLLTGVFMIALFGSRFLVEFTKDQTQFSPDFALGMGQLLSIPFVIFGIWMLVSKVNWNEHKADGN